MFHIDVTFEDLRMIATSDDGDVYRTELHDNHSGKSAMKEFEARHIAMILAFNLNSDGTPKGHEQFYAELEPLLANLPVELRPIP